MDPRFSFLPERFRPVAIPDQETMAAFRTPAVNYITRYTQMNRQQMPDEERQLLAQASRETLDNSSTGFVVGGAIPFGLLKFAKYRAGLGVIRMCAGLFGATIGSYLAAKYTTDKHLLVLMSASSDGELSKTLRDMLFEMAPRSDLYKHTQKMLKTNGFAEEAWHSKDTFAVKDAETEKWLKEDEAKTHKPEEGMEIRDSTKSSTVAGHNNNKPMKKPSAQIELPKTKDKDVAARRAAYKFFYSQEMRKLGYRRDSDTMSKEDKAKVEEAVIGKLAAWNKSRTQVKKSSSTYNFESIEEDKEEKIDILEKTQNRDTLEYNDESEDGDGADADANDFFSSFLSDRKNPDEFYDTNGDSVENNAKAPPASTTWQQYDWYYDSPSYYGVEKTPQETDKSDKRSQQNTAGARKTWSRQPVKKTTWEEIRARQKFA